MCQDWKSAEDKPTKHCVCWLRLSDGAIIRGYFYTDRMAWIEFYGYKSSYWWCSKTYMPVFNVVQWKLFHSKDVIDVIGMGNEDITKK